MLALIDSEGVAKTTTTGRGVISTCVCLSEKLGRISALILLQFLRSDFVNELSDWHRCAISDDIDIAAVNFDRYQTRRKYVLALGLSHKSEFELALVRIIIHILTQFDINCVLLVRDVRLDAMLYIICKRFKS